MSMLWEDTDLLDPGMTDQNNISKGGEINRNKCEVNIPLLKLIKSIPRYARFLKELCKVKRNQKMQGKQKVPVSEHVFAMLQKQLPTKCEDPGMFTIPIMIGDSKFDKAMLDLGASINVIPSSIYEIGRASCRERV